MQYKTLKLSDIRKSNDSKEIEFLFDEYYKWILHQNNYSSNAEHNVFVTKIDQKIQLDNTTFLVSCLSRNEDDLHMWSCYGNKGVSIEFDNDGLKKYLNCIRVGAIEIPDARVTSETPVLKVSDVCYYDSQSISNYFSSKNLNGIDDFSKILDEYPTVKSKFFECEKEVRIVYIYINNPMEKINYLSKTDNKGNPLEKVYFKSISNADFQHKMVIDIPIDLSLIKSITIGPNSTLTEQDINELLFIHGIDILVKKSSGTLR